MQKKKYLIITDDCGKRRTYTISSEKENMYYLYQRNADGWKLRYNPQEGIIEHFDPKNEIWNIENKFLYNIEIG